MFVPCMLIDYNQPSYCMLRANIAQYGIKCLEKEVDSKRFNALLPIDELALRACDKLMTDHFQVSLGNYRRTVFNFDEL